MATFSEVLNLLLFFFPLLSFSMECSSRNVGALRASALLIAISLALSWQQPFSLGSHRALSSSLADLLSASDFCFGFRLVSFDFGFLVCVLTFSRFALPHIDWLSHVTFWPLLNSLISKKKRTPRVNNMNKAINLSRSLQLPLAPEPTPE